MTFKEYIQSEINKKLIEEIKPKSSMALPRLLKVVVNVGAGEALTNKGVLDKISEQLGQITGQKAVITKARKSVAAFKVRAGVPIGVKVTLRRGSMYVFLEKLIKIVIPRIRDFRGIAESSLDANGNLNLGFSEQIIFPEVDFDKIDKVRGLQVTIVTSSRNRADSKRFFELLGIPFKDTSPQQ